MKKLLLLFCLLIPIGVKADASTPIIRTYEAIITNPNGVSVEVCDNKAMWCDNKETITIDYNTKITITQELYTSAFFCQQNKCGYIDLKDIKAIDSKNDLTQAQKLDNPEKLLVYEDIFMRAGPSQASEKNKKIPAGTIVEYEYYVEYWAYVTYDGVSGWIMREIPKFVPNEMYNEYKTATENNSTIISKNNITEILKQPLGSNEKISVNIPKNTILNSKFHILHGLWNEYIYIEYNGIDGWILTTPDPNGEWGYAINKKTTISNSNGASLYQDADLSSLEIKKLAYETEVIVLYQNYQVKMYYIKYDNMYGWIEVENLSNKFETINPEEEPSDKPNEEETIVPETPSDTPNEEETIVPETPSDTPNEDEVINPDNKDDSNKLDNSWHFSNIILAVMGAVLLSLTTLVTIILINKKRRKTN